MTAHLHTPPRTLPARIRTAETPPDTRIRMTCSSILVPTLLVHNGAELPGLNGGEIGGSGERCTPPSRIVRQTGTGYQGDSARTTFTRACAEDAGEEKWRESRTRATARVMGPDEVPTSRWAAAGEQGGREQCTRTAVIRAGVEGGRGPGAGWVKRGSGGDGRARARRGGRVDSGVREQCICGSGGRCAMRGARPHHREQEFG
ncbi:hypothetical protein B0H16DRAFT_1850763 [Mycena metata]|uniref:Uncharacterized protein n=1 Tax=Mycena metata TaxID=1033252 RepID=A0AAD7N6K3_9AGAR|nr:hypothetical protein B0H16DRAFT_1850763 [Mycena metata]